MSHSSPSTLLVRRLLITDAVVSGATGAMMAILAPALEAWLGLPAQLLRYAGVALIPFAAGVAWLALQNPPARSGVRAVIAANFAWVAASILLLASGSVSPTALGVAFVIFQAVVVAILGELQFMGLRKSTAAA